MNKISCNAIENHLCVANNRWRPCCTFMLEGPAHYTDDLDLNQYKETKEFSTVRNKLNNGVWPEGCYSCKELEDLNKSSLRMEYNKILSGTTNTIEFIEASLSDECNLSCKMCGPHASSMWNILLDENPSLQKFRKKLNEKSKAKDVNSFLRNVNLENVNRIKILGGEPFIATSTYKFFEYIDGKIDLSKVLFQCNTNATFFPKKILKFLKRFKHLSISFSIDGWKQNNDYIRQGSKWEEVVKVINQWKNFRDEQKVKCDFSTAITINAYNIHEVFKIKKWSLENGFEVHEHVLHKPDFLTLSALPEEYVLMILSHLRDNNDTAFYVKLLENTILDKNLCNRFKDFTKTMDNIMQLSLKNYNLELFKFLS